MAGKLIMVVSVACPAAKSNAAPLSPWASFWTVDESIHPPIMGWKMDVENIPIAPMIDIPKAPLKGIF